MSNAYTVCAPVKNRSGMFSDEAQVESGSKASGDDKMGHITGVTQVEL